MIAHTEAKDVPQRMYGWKETAELIGVSVRQLQDWIKEGRFPEPHKSGKTVRWFEDEIDEWQAKFKLGLVPPASEKPQKRGRNQNAAE